MLWLYNTLNYLRFLKYQSNSWVCRLILVHNIYVSILTGNAVFDTKYWLTLHKVETIYKLIILFEVKRWSFAKLVFIKTLNEVETWDRKLSNFGIM